MTQSKYHYCTVPQRNLSQEKVIYILKTMEPHGIKFQNSMVPMI